MKSWTSFFIGTVIGAFIILIFLASGLQGAVEVPLAFGKKALCIPL